MGEERRALARWNTPADALSVTEMDATGNSHSLPVFLPLDVTECQPLQLVLVVRHTVSVKVLGGLERLDLSDVDVETLKDSVDGEGLHNLSEIGAAIRSNTMQGRSLLKRRTYTLLEELTPSALASSCQGVGLKRKFFSLKSWTQQALIPLVSFPSNFTFTVTYVGSALVSHLSRKYRYEVEEVTASEAGPPERWTVGIIVEKASQMIARMIWTWQILEGGRFCT